MSNGQKYQFNKPVSDRVLKTIDYGKIYGNSRQHAIQQQ